MIIILEVKLFHTRYNAYIIFLDYHCRQQLLHVHVHVLLEKVCLYIQHVHVLSMHVHSVVKGSQ